MHYISDPHFPFQCSSVVRFFAVLRHESFTVVTDNSTVFWDATQHDLIDIYGNFPVLRYHEQHFGLCCCHSLKLRNLILITVLFALLLLLLLWIHIFVGTCVAFCFTFTRVCCIFSFVMCLYVVLFVAAYLTVDSTRIEVYWIITITIISAAQNHHIH